MSPARGEVWLADLDPVRGREHGGRRPVLVLSVDPFNKGPAGLIMAVPLTSRAKGIPSHICMVPPEGGLKTQSYAITEALRSISKERLLARWGGVSAPTMAQVEDWMRALLGL